MKKERDVMRKTLFVVLSVLWYVLTPTPAHAQTQKLVINVPDPPQWACFVNSVTVRTVTRIGNQLLLEAVPMHGAYEISASCQDGTLDSQGPTFGADAALDSVTTFPAGYSAQRQLNTLAIDIGVFPSGYHWFNATFSSGATGSVLVLVAAH